MHYSLCKPLDSKRKRGIVLRGSKCRPLTGLILFENIACSLVILAPVVLHRRLRNRSALERCNIRYPCLAYVISGESEIYGGYVKIAGKTRIPNVASFKGMTYSK